jgi:hypothetical protein
MKDERTACRTPTPGKKPTRIETWKYDAVRRAILDSLPRDGAGLPFRELSGEVRKRLDADHLERLGSVNWYTTTVKLDLEVKGEIRRVAGVNPQQLLKG